MACATTSVENSPRHVRRLRAVLLAMLATASSAQPCDGQSQLKIDLQANLVVGDENGANFGALLHVAVNSRGLIYVGDWMNTNVLVFSADGALRDTIGRRGHGPGEFTAIHDVVAGRGDSVYVYDGNAARLSVFSAASQSHSLAYTLQPQSDGLGRPFQPLIPSDSRAGYLFAFRQAASGTLSVHRTNREGAVDDRPILRGMTAEAKVNVRQAGGAWRWCAPRRFSGEFRFWE